MDSLMIESIVTPTSTGSEYRRYIYKASGSYWRPTNNTTDVVGLSTINFGTNSSEIIKTSGSSIFEKPVVGISAYQNFITSVTGSGKEISGSFVPKGDLFNISILPTGDTDYYTEDKFLDHTLRIMSSL